MTMNIGGLIHASAILIALASIVYSTPLQRQHVQRFSADGCHSYAWKPENVMDGNSDRGWITAQRDAGAGWGRHWIMLELRAPFHVRKVVLLSTQNAYANATYKDATYRAELRNEGKWIDIGSQRVEAALENKTKDLTFTLARTITTDALRVWASWEADRGATPKAYNERMRYCRIGEILIDVEMAMLANVKIAKIFHDSDILVEAELAGDVKPGAKYEILVEISRLRESKPAASAKMRIDAQTRRVAVKASQLELTGVTPREQVLAVSLLQDGEPVYSEERLARRRGRIYTDVDITKDGLTLQPGDELLLTDFSRIQPEDAISSGSAKGKWQRRRFKTDDGKSGQLLCVVERDEKHPETCIAPTLRVPLGLRGAFEIWILIPRTYRGAGVDVQLTGDDSWQELNSMMVSRYPGGPAYTKDCLVETYWATRRLNGKDLIIRQPHGTYASFPLGFCEAYFAGVRLIKISEEEAASRQKETADPKIKRVVINNDGHGIFWQWGQEDFNEYYRWVDSLADQSVHHLELCIIAGGAFNYFSEVGEMFGDGIDEKDCPRLGDKRIARTLQRFKAKGIEPLRMLIERGKKVGLPVYPSVRMDPFYSGGYARMFNGPFWRAHPELRITGSTHLDYAKTQVRDYYFRIFKELLSKFDVEGVSMDFTRHPPFFAPNEKNKEAYMTELVRQIRAEADRIGRRRGRRIALSVTFHARSYQRDGLDVATWVKEGLVNYIAPELAGFKQQGWADPASFVNMVKGTDCELFGRIEHVMGGHDPRPSENMKVTPVREHRGPKDYERLMAEDIGAGMDGIYIFNQGGQWPAMRRLGFVNEVKQRARFRGVYGVIEGPIINVEH